MLLTPEFVVINFPKTGSTFVRNALLELEKQRLYAPFLGQTLARLRLKKSQVKELLLPHPYLSNYKDQHGSVEQIPPAYSHLPIVSVARNPVDRFVSLYRFGWWKKFPHLDQATIAKWPSFPNLTLTEFQSYFYELGQHRKKLAGVDVQLPIGDQTLQFIRMFATNPQKTFRELSQDKLESGQWITELAPVHWLQQENLNEDLSIWLLNHGYTTEQAQWVKQLPPKNESAGATPDLPKDVKLWILDSEKYLLQYFGSQNITYT